MGLVHQIAPPDEDLAILSHVVGEEGTMQGIMRMLRQGHRVVFEDTLPVVAIALGSGELLEDGEDFAFENGGSE